MGTTKSDTRPLRKWLTPPQVGQRYGISADKVIGWIRAGELRAVNVAARAGRRPRWRIGDADLPCEEARQAKQSKKRHPPKRKRPKSGAVLYDWRKFSSDFGVLFRHVDMLGNSYGVKDTPEAEALRVELDKCGALIPCHHFGPDEPDLHKFKKFQVGKDLSERDNRAAMMRPDIFGRVWTWFEKLNPEHKPTILFGPDLQGSIWFAEQFWAKGVSAAHIDSENIWVNGTWHRSSREAREDVLAGSKERRIVVLCNRFVLREGINAPWWLTEYLRPYSGLFKVTCSPAAACSGQARIWSSSPSKITAATGGGTAASMPTANGIWTTLPPALPISARTGCDTRKSASPYAVHNAPGFLPAFSAVAAGWQRAGTNLGPSSRLTANSYRCTATSIDPGASTHGPKR
jgi:hypothetical protein